MTQSTLILRKLQYSDEASFMSAVEMFRDVDPDFPFALDFEEAASFSEYIDTLEQNAQGIGLAEGRVPSSFYVGVVDGEIIGRVSVRHYLNDFLERIGGHIGFAVVPGTRCRGYATEMVRQAIHICSSLGIRNVLITCDKDNVASAKVIEHCGGIYEGLTDEPELNVQKKRYWIYVPSCI